MKTVSGKVVSSHPMSLSRAAKYLSTFTASPNEASPAFAAYLRRTSDAFNQLVQLHKHCNIPIGQHSNNLNNDNHDDVLTHATATSVAIVGKGKRTKLDDDVNVDDHYDSPSVGMDLDGGRIIEGDVSDVRSDLNKSKKKKNKNKKERDGDVATAEDTRGDDHDAIKVDDVKTDMTRLVGSEEMNVSDVGAAEDTRGDDHDAIKVDDVKTDMTRLVGSEEMNVSDVGAAAKKSKKKKAKDVQLNGVDDGIEVKEVKREMGGLVASEEVTNNLPDLGVASKISKKKRGNVGFASSIEKDLSGLDSREELKKKKKSKKDKHQKENHSGATEAVKDVQLHPHKEGADTGEVADTVQNNGDERKKHKKKSKIKDDGDARKKVKEEKESSSNNKSSEQIGETKLENKHQILGEKKRLYVAEEGENGRDMETEVVRRKESRKRKHERVADGVLEGSQEAVKSKKKKL